MTKSYLTLQIERQNIETKINKLSNADESFNKTIATIFSLASKAHKLFKSSELEEKRRIITILFPNLKMDAEKLVFSLRKPFDMFVNLKEEPIWLPQVSTNTIVSVISPEATFYAEAPADRTPLTSFIKRGEGN